MPGSEDRMSEAVEAGARFWYASANVLDNSVMDAAKYPGPDGDEARRKIARAVLESAQALATTAPGGNDD
jgi:hypothetical protein